jgi:sugar lactone lactonase YvrE
MLQSNVRVFRRARSAIAESLWCNEAGDIHWCDIESGLIHTSPFNGASDGSDDTTIMVQPPIAAFQPTSHGGYVLAGGETISTCDRDGAGWIDIAQVRHANPGLRLNEGKCDPAGRFIVGSMEFLNGSLDGAIYSFESDWTARMIHHGVGVSNGFEWSSDGSRTYFSDTAKETVFVGDYSEAGHLDNIVPFITGVQVDGLTRDIDGGFWAGIYGNGSVMRFRADGSEDFAFELPAGHATAVAFGGPDMSTLFVATAREKLTEQQLERQPLTGSVFAVDTATHGLPPHEFAVPAPQTEGIKWISESPNEQRL